MGPRAKATFGYQRDLSDEASGKVSLWTNFLNHLLPRSEWSQYFHENDVLDLPFIPGPAANGESAHHRIEVKDIDLSLDTWKSSGYAPYALAFTDHVIGLSKSIDAMSKDVAAQSARSTESKSETLGIAMEHKLQKTHVRITQDYVNSLGDFIGSQQTAFLTRMEYWSEGMNARYRLEEMPVDRHLGRRVILGSRLLEARAGHYHQLTRTQTGLVMLAKSAIKLSDVMQDNVSKHEWTSREAACRDRLKMFQALSRESAELAESSRRDLTDGPAASACKVLSARLSHALLAAVPNSKHR